MFDILKKKLSKVVEVISGKTKEKEDAIKIIEKSSAEDIETKIEEVAPQIKKEIEPIIEETKPEEKKSLFKKLKEKVVKKITEKTLSEEDLESVLDELVTDLTEADVSLEVAEKIKSDLNDMLVNKEIKRGEEKEFITSSLKQSLLSILSVPRIDVGEIVKRAKDEKKPALLLFFGVNGVGKSLNLSKVAYYLKNKGYSPILGAGDTYRHAGDIQLELYGNQIGVPVIKHQRGSDSCAVIFDTVNAAKSRGYDVVLGDTSGRMHVKKDLLDELSKIVRVNKPDLKILVLDSLAGSDVIQQFEFFDRTIGVDAVIFSKNDINEKGGNILSICYLFKRPILFLGTGQSFDELIFYDPNNFVDQLIEGGRNGA